MWEFKYKTQKSQIKAIKSFLESCRDTKLTPEYRAELEASSFNCEGTDDQLSGISGIVNGQKTNCIWNELTKDLDKQVLSEVMHTVPYMYWEEGDDWVFWYI